MSMQLCIGNKNYSSWSMRPWVLLRQAEIPFAEVMLRFDAFTPDSKFKSEVARCSPAGRVPVLVDDGLAVWDTLAIAEYLAKSGATVVIHGLDPAQGDGDAFCDQPTFDERPDRGPWRREDHGEFLGQALQ